jgi:hypothetical protein
MEILLYLFIHITFHSDHFVWWQVAHHFLLFPYAMSWHPYTTDWHAAVSVTFLHTTFKASVGKLLVQGNTINIRVLIAIFKEGAELFHSAHRCASHINPQFIAHQISAGYLKTLHPENSFSDPLQWKDCYHTINPLTYPTSNNNTGSHMVNKAYYSVTKRPSSWNTAYRFTWKTCFLRVPTSSGLKKSLNTIKVKCWVYIYI